MVKKWLITIGVVLLIILIVSIVLIMNGVIVTDYSARKIGNSVEWNNRTYHPCAGRYSEGKTIAIAPNTEGRKITEWSFTQVNEVEEDPSHTFIVLRSFLDDQLYVADDYTIPKEGDITCVYLRYDRFDDVELCRIISEILASQSETFEYETDNISGLTDTQRMRTLYVGYDGCPIGTEWRGHLGKINGKWTLALPSADNENGYEPGKTVTKVCRLIDERYTQQLEKYFQEIF